MSTMNRTPQSFLGAILAAEHVLGWVPVGTHDWSRFLTPRELRNMVTDSAANDSHMTVLDTTGLLYNPLTQRWWLDKTNTDINYIIAAKRLT